jgi:hypothetical protein
MVVSSVVAAEADGGHKFHLSMKDREYLEKYRQQKVKEKIRVETFFVQEAEFTKQVKQLRVDAEKEIITRNWEALNMASMTEASIDYLSYDLISRLRSSGSSSSSVKSICAEFLQDKTAIAPDLAQVSFC